MTVHSYTLQINGEAQAHTHYSYTQYSHTHYRLHLALQGYWVTGSHFRGCS